MFNHKKVNIGVGSVEDEFQIWYYLSVARWSACVFFYKCMLKFLDM